MKKLFLRFFVFRLDSFESRFNCSFFTTISWKTFLFNSFSEISKLSVRFSSLFSFQWPFCLPYLSIQLFTWQQLSLRRWAQVESSHSPLFSLILRINIRIASFLRFRLAAFAALVGSSGVEPPTSCLSGMRSNLLSYEPILELPVGFLHLSSGGDEGIRTLDPLLAGQVLSQLSYTPVP